MKRRAIFLAFALVGALTVWACLAAGRLSSAEARHDDDEADLGALVSARSDLEAEVLELRAGLEQNFDAVNRSLRALRQADRVAKALRARGRTYAATADLLQRRAEAGAREEALVESFKTDLALLRLSSGYFSVAADAFVQSYDAGAAAETGAAADAAPVPADRAASSAGSLREGVERYQIAPNRETEDAIDHALQELEAIEPELDAARQASLRALIGHTRAILDRRERVDRTARLVLASRGRADLQAAFEDYESTARHGSAMAASLRIAAAELLAVLGLLAGGALWRWRAR